MKKKTIFKFQSVTCKLLSVVFLSVCIVFSICVYYSFAEVPCKINYQGRLIKDNVPVHNPTGVPMVFNVDGKQVYSGNVPVYNGLFRVVLDLEDKGIDWTAGETKYLEVIVDREQLSPSEPLYAYPYAINSHLLEGATKEYFLDISGSTQTKQGNLNIGGNLSVGGAQFEHKGYNFLLGTNDGRVKGNKQSQRALVHGDNDELFINYNTDFEGGVKIEPSVYISTNGNVGIGTTSPTATLDVDGTVSIFGSWTTKDSLGNTLLTGTFYQVTTDGFVCVFNYCDSNKAYIVAYTASRMYGPEAERLADIVLTQGLPLGSSRYAAVTLPVRKGDYWRIAFAEGITPTLSAIRWLPIGSGACVKQ